jgi:hypothetical protein
MPGEAARKAPQKDQEQEEGQQQRRQQDQQPQEEKHQQQRREGSGTSNTGTDAGPSNPGMNRGEMNPDAVPGREGGNRQTEKWPGENSQSGTSQAQKGAQQTDKHKQGGGDDASWQNSRENRDTGFSENRQGTGGNVDSGQRNNGQTGQTVKDGSPPEIHQQEGPYGPPDKHRGPSSPGKPLTDDWGKSDKH